MLRSCPSALLPGILAALLSLAVGNVAPALEPGGPARVDRYFGPRVAAAVADAARRLERPSCALVLTDFADSRSGLTLAENLAASGRTASEHVESLLFLGARRPRPFAGRRVFAFTVPSSPVVYLCREDLLRVQNQDRLVTAIVIHEVLHTLGLREDAPTSVAVTEQVLARCF